MCTGRAQGEHYHEESPGRGRERETLSPAPTPPPTSSPSARLPHAPRTPSARRRLQTGPGGALQAEEGPGIAALDFEFADVTKNNLGGLCGLNCHPKLEDGDQIQYDTSTGLCTFTDTSKRDSEEKEQCNPGAVHEVYFDSLGNGVNLRVTNLTEYFPFNSNSNFPSNVWGQINIQGNHAVEFLFEFIDTVRTPCPLLFYRTTRCPLACQPATVQPATALSLCRTPRSQSCWTSLA